MPFIVGLVLFMGMQAYYDVFFSSVFSHKTR